MNIWRLMSHHDEDDQKESLKMMIARNRIAVGWSNSGDLSTAGINNKDDISALITRTHPGISSVGHGRASLWNLYSEMEIDDLVIVVVDNKAESVFQVIGNYIYESGEKQIIGYSHQRPAVLTNIDADNLWRESGGQFAEGQNRRWALALVDSGNIDKEEIQHQERQRYSVTSTVIERNPSAREACITHRGSICAACEFNFTDKYGISGPDLIHVHHVNDLSLSDGQHNVDPIKDLIPLCPNCHAMIHTERPAMDLEKLRRIIIN
ncbi:hypothetical protein S1OALGB6SA_1192 [Olavius algarvensis spirochete endosymbiont]|uniref:HNH endonuclease n=1 Tax=Olavius algarvensis spirochete endosymbiont TaxID=260710 RepID=UPI000F0FD3B4|nr:HNH endonuclease [Olavius algarvensis spirochete endosymbiont]VDB00118.1 hypothetical protein S1OALGB6SA_1192 [Olavius algarvensis spirochete endosymbiont]